MPTAADALPQCSFATIMFPYESIDVESSVRDHVHVYPHSPGGAPEKLGRNLSTIRITANFSSRFRLYPNLWPRDLDRLVKLFETETTDLLVVPSLRTHVSAYCTKWNRHLEARMRSGEKVTLEFREDQSGDFLSAALETVSNEATLVDRQAELDAQLVAIRLNYRNQRDKDIFDRIRDLTNSIAAVGDQRDLAAGVLDSRLAQLSQLCAVADSLPQMGGAEAWPAVNALQEIWKTAVVMREDTLGTGHAKLVEARVPYTMSVQQLASWLYGDTERASDLLSLNATITDAGRIVAGTKVRYYPADE